MLIQVPTNSSITNVGIGKDFNQIVVHNLTFVDCKVIKIDLKVQFDARQDSQTGLVGGMEIFDKVILVKHFNMPLNKGVLLCQGQSDTLKNFKIFACSINSKTMVMGFNIKR